MVLYSITFLKATHDVETRIGDLIREMKKYFFKATHDVETRIGDLVREMKKYFFNVFFLWSVY